jgi:hypothetical protein
MVKANYITIKIPGRTGEKLGIVSLPNQDDGAYKRTPEWLISFDTLSAGLSAGTSGLNAKLGSGSGADRIMAASSTYNLQAFTELFGWNMELNRFTHGHTSHSLMPSGSVQLSPLTIMIPSGIFAANAEKAMFRGTIIAAITIVRTGFIAGTLQILQTVVFRKCRITKFQQQLDRLIMHFSVLEKETTMFVFDQKGRPCGFAAGASDVRQNCITNL